MLFKNHTGITFSLIGILIPFLGTVCMASTRYNIPYFSGPIHESEKAIALEESKTPVSRSVVKQDVEFIHRLKNDHFIYGNNSYVYNSSLNYSLHPKIFPALFSLVPKPAYYNHLFLFKPF